MKNRSKKNKELRFLNHLVPYFQETIDKDAYKVSASGAGLDKQDIRCPNLNIEWEAKNYSKQLPLKTAFTQAQEQRTEGNIPIVVMRHPDYPEFEKSVVALDLDDFLELLSTNIETTVSKELPKELEWYAKDAKKSAHKLLKELKKFKYGN